MFLYNLVVGDHDQFSMWQRVDCNKRNNTIFYTNLLLQNTDLQDSNIYRINAQNQRALTTCSSLLVLTHGIKEMTIYWNSWITHSPLAKLKTLDNDFLDQPPTGR